MGTNIHSLALADFASNSEWSILDYPLWPDALYDPKRPVEFGNTSFTNEPFSVRQYPLYGALAGVRREEFPQIHAVRGLPESISPEDKIGDYTWKHLHDASWATFAELDRYMTRLRLGSLGWDDSNLAVAGLISQALMPLRTLHERNIPLVIAYAFDN